MVSYYKNMEAYSKAIINTLSLSCANVRLTIDAIRTEHLPKLIASLFSLSICTEKKSSFV